MIVDSGLFFWATLYTYYAGSELTTPFCPSLSGAIRQRWWSPISEDVDGWSV